MTTKVIRKCELSRMLGLSPRQIDRLESEGQFPERIQLGRQSVGWDIEEVEDWIQHRPRGFLPPVRQLGLFK